MSATSAPTAFIRCKAWRCSPTWATCWRCEAAAGSVAGGRRPVRRRACEAKATIWCCGRRARWRSAQACRRAKLTLTKNLPVASGIGGGSRRCGGGAARRCASCGACDLDDARAARHRGRAGLRYSGLRLPARRAFMEGRGEILRAGGVAAARCRCCWSIPAWRCRPRMCSPRLQARSGVEMALPRGRFRRHSPICCVFWKPPATIWKRRRAALQPVIGEVLAALTALPGALVHPHVGLRRHLFRACSPMMMAARARRTLLKQKHPGWWIAPTFVPETGIVHESARPGYRADAGRALATSIQ